MGLTAACAPKLLDCGLSKTMAQLPHAARSGGASPTGSEGSSSGEAFSIISGAGLVGTPGYSPPEVGMGVYSTGSEAYSFGVVLYELLSGARVGLRTVADARRAAARVEREGGPGGEGGMGALFSTWADAEVGEGESWAPTCLEALGRLFLQCTAPDDRDRPSLGLVVAELATLKSSLRMGAGREVGLCIHCDEEAAGDAGAWCKAEVEQHGGGSSRALGEGGGSGGTVAHFLCSPCLQKWALKEGALNAAQGLIRCPWAAQCRAPPWSIAEENFQAQLTPATAAKLCAGALSAAASAYGRDVGGAGGSMHSGSLHSARQGGGSLPPAPAAAALSLPRRRLHWLLGGAHKGGACGLAALPPLCPCGQHSGAEGC